MTAPPTVRESLREYGRGLAGGFLFSLPLLLTMEVWFIGVSITPARLLVGIFGTLLLLCAYNAYAGLRHDSGFLEILIDSVEELGLGLTVSALALWMLARIEHVSLSEFMGPLVLEGLFVAIGVSVGTAQLAMGDEASTGAGQGRQDSLQAELTLALCGAVLIAANVAPTEEVALLAASMRLPHLVGLMAASVLLATTLLFFSNFRGSARFADTRGAFAVIHGAMITYAVALVASAGLLWFFGRFDQNAVAMDIGQSIVLAFPATLGAAAGRLLLR